MILTPKSVSRKKKKQKGKQEENSTSGAYRRSPVCVGYYKNGGKRHSGDRTPAQPTDLSIVRWSLPKHSIVGKNQGKAQHKLIFSTKGNTRTPDTQRDRKPNDDWVGQSPDQLTLGRGNRGHRQKDEGALPKRHPVDRERRETSGKKSGEPLTM